MLKQQDLFPGQGMVLAGAPRWAQLFCDAIVQAQKDLSDNTKKTYRMQAEAWESWCLQYGATVHPIDPREFMAHVEWMKQQQYKRSSIRLRIDAISKMDAMARATAETPNPTPLAQHHAIRRWWKGYAREHPARTKRAPFVSRAELTRLVESLYARRMTPSRIIHAARDRALILLGYLGAFRREELSRLTLGQVERHSRGLYVRWDHSKGDQLSEGDEVLILPQAELVLCAVDAWDAWYSLYRAEPLFGGVEPDPSTPAFPVIVGPRVQAHALRPHAIYQMLVAHGERIGLKLSPHSLRASFATHSLEVHEESEVQAHGRWRDRKTMAHYIRRSRTWKKNPTAGLSSRET